MDIKDSFSEEIETLFHDDQAPSGKHLGAPQSSGDAGEQSTAYRSTLDITAATPSETHPDGVANRADLPASPPSKAQKPSSTSQAPSSKTVKNTPSHQRKITPIEKRLENTCHTEFINKYKGFSTLKNKNPVDILFNIWTEEFNKKNPKEIRAREFKTIYATLLYLHIIAEIQKINAVKLDLSPLNRKWMGSEKKKGVYSLEKKISHDATLTYVIKLNNASENESIDIKKRISNESFINCLKMHESQSTTLDILMLEVGLSIGGSPYPESNTSNFSCFLNALKLIGNPPGKPSWHAYLSEVASDPDPDTWAKAGAWMQSKISLYLTGIALNITQNSMGVFFRNQALKAWLVNHWRSAAQDSVAPQAPRQARSNKSATVAAPAALGAAPLNHHVSLVPRQPTHIDGPAGEHAAGQGANRSDAPRDRKDMQHSPAESAPQDNRHGRLDGTLASSGSRSTSAALEPVGYPYDALVAQRPQTPELRIDCNTMDPQALSVIGHSCLQEISRMRLPNQSQGKLHPITPLLAHWTDQLNVLTISPEMRTTAPLLKMSYALYLSALLLKKLKGLPLPADTEGISVLGANRALSDPCQVIVSAYVATSLSLNTDLQQGLQNRLSDPLMVKALNRYAQQLDPLGVMMLAQLHPWFNPGDTATEHQSRARLRRTLFTSLVSARRQTSAQLQGWSYTGYLAAAANSSAPQVWPAAVDQLRKLNHQLEGIDSVCHNLLQNSANKSWLASYAAAQRPPLTLNPEQSPYCPSRK
jgi:hypothetical protein